MYPRLQEGVEMGTFRYEDEPWEEHYYAVNPKGREFELSAGVYRALAAADGTHALPLSRPAQRRVKKCGLVTTRRLMLDGWLNRFVLFPVGARASRLRPLCRVVDMLLPVVSVTAMLFAAAFLWQYRFYPYEVNIPWVSAVVMVLSCCLHELGHLAAGIDYDTKPSEMGVLLLLIFPIGAYVACQEGDHLTWRQRLQLCLAGVEGNLLLAGICTLLGQLLPQGTALFLLAVKLNLELAILNLLPVAGLDGEAALSALLQVDSIGRIAEETLESPKKRRRLWRAGPAGWLCLAAFAGIGLCKCAVVMLSVLGVLYMVVCAGLLFL